MLAPSFHVLLTSSGVEQELFIVTSTVTSEQLLVSLTERYLLEKNLDGDIEASLELKCLHSVQVAPPGGADTDIRLQFDYVKRDKKERNYGMEDAETAKV